MHDYGKVNGLSSLRAAMCRVRSYWAPLAKLRGLSLVRLKRLPKSREGARGRERGTREKHGGGGETGFGGRAGETRWEQERGGESRKVCVGGAAVTASPAAAKVLADPRISTRLKQRFLAEVCPL